MLESDSPPYCCKLVCVSLDTSIPARTNGLKICLEGYLHADNAAEALSACRY